MTSIDLIMESMPIRNKSGMISQTSNIELPKTFNTQTTDVSYGSTNINSRYGIYPAGTQHVHHSETRRIPLTSNPPNRSFFMTKLSADLHYYLITQYLDFDSLIALRQTCRKMRDILTPTLVRRLRAEFVKDFLAEETIQLQEYQPMYPTRRFGRLWDIFRTAFDWYPVERPSKELRCYGCLQMKPVWCFVERMSVRGTGLAGKLAKDRMCKDCMSRYRQVVGVWWKENWVKTGEVVRRSGRVQRWRKWALQGVSPINPPKEIGVCASCKCGPYDLWWGCAGCFEKEEQCRRKEDLETLDGVTRKAAGAVQAWKVQREDWRRKKLGRRHHKRKKWLSLNFGLTWQGDLEDRKQSLLEWKRSRRNQQHHHHPHHHHHQQDFSKTSSSTLSRLDNDKSTIDQSSTSPTQIWRAVDQLPIQINRREARCSVCWIPNCPSRIFMIGLAYERPLPQNRWCDSCQLDFQSKNRKKLIRRDKIYDDNDDETERGLDGVANLFDQS